MAAADEPVAVVDIGSNSVRLVIYDGLRRAPFTIHNEKAICAIGRNMVTTGRLNDEGIALALEALARFRNLCDGHATRFREAVATAAARDAENGRDFVKEAERAWGGPVRVLSGEEEANLAAEGVLSGAPDADGLVADLGGGSLDMVAVADGRTGPALTLPFGPLRLMDLARGDLRRARDIVDEGLAAAERLGTFEGRTLYAVGGIWRSLARIDMVDTRYPLHVLHGYRIPRARALKLAKLVGGLSRKSIDKMKVVPRRRAEALPYGAIVLERLLACTGLDDVVISAYGLREGLLFARLAPAERARDPLLEFAAEVNALESRAAGHAGDFFRWSAPLFPDETAEAARIRHAAACFCDIGWRRHPDDRALGAFSQVLTAPFAGADHRTRAIIAGAVYHRYSGDDEFPGDIGLHNLLDPEAARHALQIGLAARLAFLLSASAEGRLALFPLRRVEGNLVLEVPARHRAVLAEPVLKRLAELAEACEVAAQVAVKEG